MKVPLLDLNAHHAPLQEEIFRALHKVYTSQHFILGEEVRQLEQAIASYCGVKNGVGVSSGTDALLISLMALGVGPGDEVITTDYSFFATAGVIDRLGATPVFADIDPATFNICPDDVRKKITPKVKAIIPVHLFGQCADMDALVTLGREQGIPLIEDAAQSIGAEFPTGKRAGSFGIAGCFSFFPSKNLGGWGDGGMVVTHDDAFAEKLRVLRMHGAKPKYYHSVVGGNFRLDTLQAAIVLVKLKFLDQWIRQRQEKARVYEKLFQEADMARKVTLGLPQPIYETSGVANYHVFNQYVIRVPDQGALRSHLQENGVESAIYYPRPLHLQECFQKFTYAKGDFPESEKAAAETVALPIYPELTPTMQEYVVSTISRFYAGKSAQVVYARP